MDSNTDHRSKFVKDVIHGYVKISPICVKIMDTPEFHRLRYIKQLSFAYFVYPSANHTRFEHCIGVSYLAGKMARQLLEASDDGEEEKASWIKCAEIAGLCHDIGHGPFSHAYEEIKPDFKHEDNSVTLFVRLCDREKLVSNNMLTKNEQEIIKAMIQPDKYENTIKENKDKEFMFQIVSNEENGVDVDKWDYLQRDAFYLGMSFKFEYIRLIAHAKAVEVDGKKHICYPIKLKEHLHGMYLLRRWNTNHAYQHRVVLCIQTMIIDAIREAEFEIPEDATDAIYFDLKKKMYDLKNKKLTDLIEGIESRDLYISLGEIPKHILAGSKEDAEKIFPEKDKAVAKKHAKERFLEKFKDAKDIPDEDELRVADSTFKYGEKAKKAFKKLYFYSKNNPQQAEALPEKEIQEMFSAPFSEAKFYFFSTRKEQKTRSVKGDFEDLIKKIETFCRQ